MSFLSVEEEYRAFLPRLLSLHPRESGTDSEVGVREPYREVAHVAYGWFMRCHRGIQAVLMLEEEGFQVEAAPIRRSVLEHVVALKWLAAQGSVAAGILRRGASNDARKRREAVRNANWTSVDLDLFDAVVQDGEGLDRQHDNLLAFKARCEKFGTSDDMVLYLAETAQSHPCWQSASPYLDLSSGKPVPLVDPGSPVDQAGFCVVHLIEALLCVNQIFESSILSADLEEILPAVRSLMVRQGEELGLPVPHEIRHDT
ncbi:DUF5677 domain-containing protein [Pseudarthrobacter sp. NamB4]|uniref:DUF5677 domain-containing protein n=1 Tax=Pseudarthrobacter sp. NamB4 TaxID=2576837 RepID=UPI0010FE6A0A|nr:DUF5677 domain-containing protein [Pseudarthrobacter sp. NamB4]TLM73133.1 hypothetical protein FDW81_10680 [Pseudarthrobacter sp. NamB4]